jgi:cobyric acid synthase
MSAATTARTRKKLTDEELKAEEKKLKDLGYKIVPGTLKNANGRRNAQYHQKRTVEITCSKRGCTVTRRVATSDLHQVTMCEEHTKEARLQRRREARQLKKQKPR